MLGAEQKNSNQDCAVAECVALLEAKEAEVKKALEEGEFSFSWLGVMCHIAYGLVLWQYQGFVHFNKYFVRILRKRYRCTQKVFFKFD